MFDPNLILSLPVDVEISNLSKARLKIVQRALSWMTYPISKIDGQFGPNTRNAFAEFKSDHGLSIDNKIDENCKAIWVASIHKTIEIMTLDVGTKPKARKAMKAMCENLGLGLKTQIAYVWATADWETARTFKPVKEAFWLSETWRKNNLHYYPYYGRGYVQLTWKRNYAAYADILEEPLAADLDLALRPDVALFVLVHGFKLGVFTGRKLQDFVNDSVTDFKNARKCINGLDKWSEIKSIAEDYLPTV